MGDFVLRLEMGSAVSPDDSAARRAVVQPQGASPMGLPTHEMPVQAPPPMRAPAATHSAPAIVSSVGSPRSGSPVPPPSPAVSHFPLERDPDSESAPEMPGASIPKMPGPPRVPQGADSRPRGGATAAHVERGMTPPRRPHSVAPPLPARAAQSAPAPPPAHPPVAAEPRHPSTREAPALAARRLALITLVDRVADAVDLGGLARSPVVAGALAQQIEGAIREQAKAMRAEGEAPDGVDLDVLARDAMREFVGLGPLGPLLEDDETSEVHVIRPDHVVVRRGGSSVLTEPSFTSDEAVARVVMRLAHQSGNELRPDERVVERRLGRGAHLIAIAPVVAAGWVLTVRKRRRVEASLDELVRAGAMSRAMALFLETCVAARANILVAGSGAGAVSSMIGALGSAVPPGERIAMLHDVDDIAVPQAQVVSLTLGDAEARGAEVVRAGARLGLDRLIVVSLAGAVALATIDAIGEGTDAVLAGVGAPSLRHGLARLAAQVAMARPGAAVEAAREAVGESFDVAVEVVSAKGGGLRVARVAEIEGVDATGVVARDLFISEVDRDGQWSFIPTGTVPRLSGDFSARGVRLDPGLFRASR